MSVALTLLSPSTCWTPPGDHLPQPCHNNDRDGKRLGATDNTSDLHQSLGCVVVVSRTLPVRHPFARCTFPVRLSSR